MPWNKGRKPSPEEIAKRVAAIRATGVYERNREFIIARNKSTTGTKLSEEHKKNISLAMQGKRNSLGSVRSMEYKKNLSEYWKDNPNHNHWVDGKSQERSSERVKEMGRLEYREWRKTVFKRDNYTCIECKQIGGSLQADHIKPYCNYPSLRYEISNGRTLCKNCHLKTDTWGWKARAA